MADTSIKPVQVPLTPGQLRMLDEFRRSEGLASETEALKLLLEIAFEVVTGTGTRFWDRAAPTPGSGPPRR